MFNKTNKEPIYFITGGGTGGHIYPAVSIIRSLLDSNIKNENIYYIGNEKNLENEIAQKNGFNFLSHSAYGMPRKISFQLLHWFFALLIATIKTFGHFIKYKPSVIFATGGYICAPVLFCAKLLNIPYVLHDCDIHPGIVTRFFAPGAKSVSLSFESAKKYINSKNIFINGNPIRQEFKTISKKQAREELSLNDNFTILIMGGSLGAKTINDSSFEILRNYANKDGYTIIWQTGKKNFDEVMQKVLKEFEQLPHNLVLQPYYDKMHLALLSADVAISRAGSLSLSEICASSLPSILIPYPFAAADHQKKNAQSMVENNMALMLEDKNCNNETLFKMLEDLINNKKLLSDLSYNAYKNAKLDSAEKIVEQINNAIQKK